MKGTGARWPSAAHKVSVSSAGRRAEDIAKQLEESENKTALGVD